MGFQYNGKLRCAEVIIIDRSFKQIRRKETIDDYLSTVIDYTNTPHLKIPL
jgi:diaminopimelate decarboxylase